MLTSAQWSAAINALKEAMGDADNTDAELQIARAAVAVLTAADEAGEPIVAVVTEDAPAIARAAGGAA